MTQKEQEIINGFIKKVANSGVMVNDSMLDPENATGKYYKVLKTSDFLSEWKEACEKLNNEQDKLDKKVEANG